MATAAKLACACLLAASLGCGSPAFVCRDDAQCGSAGACEPEGWCSFPDDACGSGRRFGAHAGGEFGERCVPVRDDTGTSDGSTTGTPPGETTAIDGDSSSSSSDGPAQRDTEAMGTDATSSTGDPEPIDPTLLVWLTFDEPDAAFDDRSGNGLHATCELVDCPLAEAGPRGLAMRFDGEGDHLRLPQAEALVTEGALTCALWIDVVAVQTGAYQDVVARALGAGNENSWAIGFPNNYPDVRTVLNDGVTQLSVGEIEWPTRFGWHHVALTWDGARARTYIDGELLAETEIGGIAFDGHELLIGADSNDRIVGNFFAGALDDVRIYRRALDEAEIDALLAD